MTFRQEYQRGKQREKIHAEKYINIELDEKIRSSKTGSKHSKKSTGSKHSKKSTGVPPDITIKREQNEEIFMTEMISQTS